MIVVENFFDKDTKEKLNYTAEDRFHAILGSWQGRDKKADLTRYKGYFSKFGNPDCSGKVVLDIGCGPWGGILPLTEAKRKVGVDPMIGEYIKSNMLSYDGECVTSDDAKIDLPDDFADVIFCLNTLDHCFDIESPAKLLKEIHRLLKPEGLLYIHSHLRKGEQLNLLHFYAIEDKDLNRWMSDFERVHWQIYEEDSVWDRPYRTLWGILKK